ncbi:hypothetical protein [Nonomuraea sp. NPDC003214]
MKDHPHRDSAPQGNEFGRHADLVQLTKRATEDGWAWSLTIDGYEFPYLLAPDSVIPVTNDEWPSIVLTMYADHVQVENQMRFLRNTDGEMRWTPHPARWEAPPLEQAGGITMVDPEQWAVAEDRIDNIPRLLQVRRNAGFPRWELLIDGQEFPFRLGPTCDVSVDITDEGGLPRVRFTLLAKRLETRLDGPFPPVARDEGGSHSVKLCQCPACTQQRRDMTGCAYPHAHGHAAEGCTAAARDLQGAQTVVARAEENLADAREQAQPVLDQVEGEL